MVATNEYRPCVWCEPLPVRAIGISFGGLTGNGSQATHHTHGTSLTPWRGPADLRKGAPPPSPVLVPQPPWERTSTAVDGSGPSLSENPLPGPSDCHQDQPGEPPFRLV